MSIWLKWGLKGTAVKEALKNIVSVKNREKHLNVRNRYPLLSRPEDFINVRVKVMKDASN